MRMVVYRYPFNKSDDDFIVDEFIKGIDAKYKGRQKGEILYDVATQINAFMGTDMASACRFLVEVFRAVDAKPEEFILCGAAPSALIFYALGLSDMDPIDSNPALYRDFYMGRGKNRCPSLEFLITRDLQFRLLDYFKCCGLNMDYAVGEEDIKRLEGRPRLSRTITFTTIMDENKVKNMLMHNKVVELVKPVTLADYVKCFGLCYGKGTWEGNGEDLFKCSGMSLQDLIADREDVYEFLERYFPNYDWDDFNIKYQGSFNMAEYVGFGKVDSYGWPVDILDAMEVAGVPDWFIKSCEKIMYLYPRAHSMMLFKHFCPEIFNRRDDLVLNCDVHF